MNYSVFELEALRATFVSCNISYDERRLNVLLRSLSETRPMAQNQTAVSYTRFSSAGQAEGDSFRRQTEASEKYATEHNLILDKTLSFNDLGVSAFDKSNIKKGLGLLLKAVEQGKIQRGSTLIVESLDRLSRAQVLDALEIFISILNAGLTIVTLIDKQVYSRESVASNFGQLLTSIVIMQRAYEESATKSMRGKEAWRQKHLKAKAEGTVISRKVPYWIRAKADRSGFELHPERADVVRRLVQQSISGVGNHTIIRQLNADGIEAWSKEGVWAPSYIQKLLNSAALYGSIQLKNEIIENYYPPIMTKAEFQHMCALRRERATRQVTAQRGDTVSNLFTRKLKCGYCGFSMNIAGYKSNVTGYERKYFGCMGARTGNPAGCKKMTMWFLDEFEPKALTWLTTVSYSSLFGTDFHKLDEARKELQDVQTVREELQRKTQAIVAAIEESKSSKTLFDRLNVLEQQAEDAELQLAEKQQTYDLLKARDLSGATRMQSLIALFKLLKRPMSGPELRGYRQQLCVLIDQAVTQIDLFGSGPTAKGSKAERYMVVTLKNGQTFEIDDSDDGDEAYHADPKMLAEVA